MLEFGKIKTLMFNLHQEFLHPLCLTFQLLCINQIFLRLMINRSIKKHGINNFKREIINWYDYEVEMLDDERRVVNNEFINSNKTYNCIVGGQGGAQNIETRKRISKSKTGMKFSDDHIKNLKLSHIGILMKEDTKKKLSILNSGSNNKFYGKRFTDEQLEKIKLARVNQKNLAYKKIYIKDVLFDSLKAAAEYYNVSTSSISQKLKSEKFKNYRYA